MTAIGEPRGGASRFVGASVKRREDPRLLTGHGEFVADKSLPGMLHAAFVRSPMARGVIRSVELEEARALPGVVGIYTAHDIRDDAPSMPMAMAVGLGAVNPPTRPHADRDVRFVGDPIVLIVAESRYVAEDACELVQVDIEPLTAIVDYDRATETTGLVHPELESNVSWQMGTPADPELEAAFDAADVVCDHVFRQHRQCNAPMETRGVLAHWESHDGDLTIWLSTQAPHWARTYFAQVLSVPEHRLRVIMRDVGGGFGQKIWPGREEIAVVAAARHIGRPVKWIEDRQENLMASNHAREERMRVRLGMSKDGLIDAAAIDYVEDVGSYPLSPIESNGLIGVTMFTGPYRVPRYGWHASAVFTNTCGRGAYRGPWCMETLGRECMMDIAAREIGIDPLELRRRNVLHSSDQPYASPSQAVFDRVTPAETLEQAAELIGYEAFRHNQAALRREGRYVGIGFSVYLEPTGGGDGPGGHEVATIRVEPSGKVIVLMGTASHGHSLETTMVQVVAEHLGVDIEDVVLLQGDTASAPYGGGTVGTRSAVIAGSAARISAERLQQKVLRIAADMLEISESDLEMTSGVISVAGSPDVSITLRDVAQRAYFDARNLPDGMEPGLENTSRYQAPPSTHSNATHACTCEVDTATGRVTLTDYVVSEDCGVRINPMVVEGQIAGGVAQGIGGALLEHMIYDDGGNPLTITFKDYLLPTAEEVPVIRYGHIETPSDTPGGHKGVGEGGTIGSGAAIVNAVVDALTPLGVRYADQPLSPERVLALIRAAQSSGVPVGPIASLGGSTTTHGAT